MFYGKVIKLCGVFSLLLGVGNLYAEAAPEDELCHDQALFIQDGWQQQTVQDAMDDYLRDHRMHANWLQEPVPPDQIGKDYYEWLWHNRFGATMKRQLVHRFCSGSAQKVTD